jgi:hypothetical protein
METFLAIMFTVVATIVFGSMFLGFLGEMFDVFDKDPWSR